MGSIFPYKKDPEMNEALGMVMTLLGLEKLIMRMSVTAQSGTEAEGIPNR